MSIGSCSSRSLRARVTGLLLVLSLAACDRSSTSTEENDSSTSRLDDTGSIARGEQDTASNDSSRPPVLDGQTSETSSAADTGSGGGVDTGTGAPQDGGSSETTHFAAYGDSRTNVADHQSVLDAIAKVNPQLIVNTGDLWDGYGSTQWTTMVRKNANLGALLDANLFLVSRGNHESSGTFLAYRPSLVRGGKELYSYTVGNSFFVSLSIDPTLTEATTFLDQQMQTAAAKAATWRFVYSHYPIYSGGTGHGASGAPAVEALCDKYHVHVYFTGHDHDYERSQQLFGTKIVDTGNALTASKGTVYIVTGGGGAPLYDVNPIATTHFALKTLHFVDVTATASTLTVQALGTNGKPFDTFTMSR